MDIKRMLAKGIRTVFNPNELPKDDYEKLVCACDVGLVFLDYRFTIPNFPSRILSYMQASKPVIVATDPNTDMGDIVEKNGFGWKCLSKNPDEFLLCVRKALESDLTVMGKIGRRYLEDNYNSKNGFEVIIKHFKENKSVKQKSIKTYKKRQT